MDILTVKQQLFLSSINNLSQFQSKNAQLLMAPASQRCELPVLFILSYIVANWIFWAFWLFIAENKTATDITLSFRKVWCIFRCFPDVLWTNDCFFFLLLIKKIYDGQSIMNKSLDVALLPAWLEEEEGEEAEKYVFCYKGEQTFKKQPLQQLLHTTIFMSNKLKKYKHVEAPPNLMWGM